MEFPLPRKIARLKPEARSGKCQERSHLWCPTLRAVAVRTRCCRAPERERTSLQPVGPAGLAVWARPMSGLPRRRGDGSSRTCERMAGYGGRAGICEFSGDAVYSRTATAGYRIDTALEATERPLPPQTASWSGQPGARDVSICEPQATVGAGANAVRSTGIARFVARCDLIADRADQCAGGHDDVSVRSGERGAAQLHQCGRPSAYPEHVGLRGWSDRNPVHSAAVRSRWTAPQ
jgi:hypothetical protein